MGKLQAGTIDLAVIDIMMPGLDGFNLTKKIREKYNIPVIILSARSEDRDKILGLGLGADSAIMTTSHTCIPVLHLQNRSDRKNIFVLWRFPMTKLI